MKATGHAPTFGQRINHIGFTFNRVNSRMGCHWQTKCAATCKQICNFCGTYDIIDDERFKRQLTVFRGLQKRAGRWRNRRFSHRQLRRCFHRQQLTVPCQAHNPVLNRQLCQRRLLLRASGLCTGNVQINARIGNGDGKLNLPLAGAILNCQLLQHRNDA